MSDQHAVVNSAEIMNSALTALYEGYLPKLNRYILESIIDSIWKAEDVSKLFFMNVDEEYILAPTRILFVGRETYGWGAFEQHDTVNGLMSNYQNVSDNGKHSSSPFWWFRQHFSESFGINNNFMKATLWTNLSKIDVAKKLPTGPKFGELSQVFMNLLVEEIKITKPDIVLILTTHGHYTWHLNNYNWLENRPFCTSDKQSLTREWIFQNKVSRLISPENLPCHTYNLCHPNALHRRKIYDTGSAERIQAINAAYFNES